MTKRRSGPRVRSDLQANRESKDGKILSAFRKVDDGSSSLIGGVLGELMRSGDIPEINIAYSHRVFILDPRMIDKRFNRGFLAGYQCARVSRGVEENPRVGLEEITADIENVSLLANKRKTLLLGLSSELLVAECTGFNTIMAQAGVRGYGENGRIHGRRLPGVLKISIGNFKQSLSRDAEPDVVEAVSLGIEQNFAQQDNQVTLGALDVKAYKPGT